jgi:hypothetical protein
MLALAVALDPANERARELATSYQDGSHEPAPDPERTGRSLATLWQVIAWLETPQAGADGQALAACLMDVAAVADPRHPRAAVLRQSGEKGAWAGWVPALAAYEVKKSIDVPEKPDPTPADPEPSADPAIRLAKAQIETLLWQKSGSGDSAQWSLGPAPLQMVAEKISEDGHQPFSLVIGDNDESKRLLEPTAKSIEKLLLAQHQQLPKGIRIHITGPGLAQSLSSKRKQSISAAAAVLASAALTGVDPDALVIGGIDDSGAFKLPSGFWNQLLGLGSGGGRRLVVPAAATAYLPSILAMEKPEVFMEFEVLLAKDFAQLLELTAKTPDGPAAAATTKFREIRSKAGGQDVRTYVANRFVRQRLAELSQEAPWHASAGMLYTQGSGNRPTQVVRAVLAAELQRATTPMAAVADLPDWHGDNEILKQVGEIHDRCRADIDRMERYSNKADQDLLENARNTANSLRVLDRAARARGEQYLVQASARTAKAAFAKLYRKLVAMLAKEVGDPVPAADAKD